MCRFWQAVSLFAVESQRTTFHPKNQTKITHTNTDAAYSLNERERASRRMTCVCSSRTAGMAGMAWLCCCWQRVRVRVSWMFAVLVIVLSALHQLNGPVPCIACLYWLYIVCCMDFDNDLHGEECSYMFSGRTAVCFDIRWIFKYMHEIYATRLSLGVRLST